MVQIAEPVARLDFSSPPVARRDPLARNPITQLRQSLPPALAARLLTGRELAAGQSPIHREAPLPTSLPALDRLLGGGLERGVLTELVGGRSSGRFAAVLAALAAATAAGEAAALVDLGGNLDPQAAAALGCDLERLLWVRPERMRDALLATELLLRSGFPLVVLDLGTPPLPGGSGPEPFWVRLARAADEHRAALLVASPYRASGTAAGTVLRARRRRAAWNGRGPAPRLLCGLDAEIVLDKLRHRATSAAASAARTTSTENLAFVVPGTHALPPEHPHPEPPHFERPCCENPHPDPLPGGEGAAARLMPSQALHLLTQKPPGDVPPPAGGANSIVRALEDIPESACFLNRSFAASPVAPPP
ncbi:MAG: hypothetical protein ACM3OB_05680 [Acidobacteriota bacterium]